MKNLDIDIFSHFFLRKHFVVSEKCYTFAVVKLKACVLMDAAEA